jgi:drug/metabolite transporter (DMT)-like permease
MAFLTFVNNSVLVAVLGAILYSIQNYIEKLIFRHPGGDVNKYYLVRNFIISWGFMFFLIWMYYFENQFIDYKTAMETVSWGAFFNDNYLMGLSVLASCIVIVSVYVSYLGIKFNPLSRYVPIQTLVYLVLTVAIGYLLLDEKINKQQIAGLVLGAIAIYLIQNQSPVRTTTISIAE